MAKKKVESTSSESEYVPTPENMTYELFCEEWYNRHNELYTEMLVKIANELNEYFKTVKDTYSTFCTFYFSGKEGTYSTYEWDEGMNSTYIIYEKDLSVVQQISYELVLINNKYQNEMFAKCEADWTAYQKGEYNFEDDETTDYNRHKTDEEETSLLESIESDEIETVSGITLSSDGSYAISHSKTLQELMALFMQWWELVQTLKKSADQAKETSVEATAQESTDSELRYEINALVVIKSGLDKYGHAMREGMVCPGCGLTVRNLKLGGFCSTECMIKYTASKAMLWAMKPNDKYKEFNLIINDLTAILDLTSLILNALMGIPNIIKELANIPDEYKQYVLLKINEGFCYLYEAIQKLMVKKNDLIKKLLSKIKMGWIAKPLEAIFTAIEAIKIGLEYAQEGFDTAYTYAMQILQSLQVSGMSIPANGFAWACSLRSYVGAMPYTCPDTGKIFINLPGGSGLLSITNIKPLLPSAVLNINFEAIDTIIQNAFPPLTPVDYYLEPELFDVRYLFSDQSDLVLQIRQQLEAFLTGGPDYLPKFENLLPVKKNSFTVAGLTIDIWLPNIAYIWFLMGLMDAWAPHSQALVGSYINTAT